MISVFIYEEAKVNDSVKMRTTHARSLRTPKKCEQCQVNLDMYLVSGTRLLCFSNLHPSNSFILRLLSRVCVLSLAIIYQ